MAYTASFAGMGAVLIEQGIYFGLGFVVAALAALCFLPVLWARALRLTRLRLQRLIPVSMQEILADRDQLRAQFAVERRKLEQVVDQVRATEGRAKADLGRRVVEVVALTDTIATLESRARGESETIVRLQRDVDETRAQLGALQVALDHAHGSLDERRREFADIQHAHHAAEIVAEEHRASVAGLSTRAIGLELTIEDAGRARAVLERELHETRQALTAARMPSPQPGPTAGPVGWSPASSGAGDVEAAQGRIRALEAELAAALEAAKEREKGLQLQTSLRSKQARRAKADGDPARASRLAAENEALRIALDALQQATPGADATKSDMAKNDAALRATIHEIGVAVARMVAAEEGDAPSSSTLAMPLPGPGVGATSLS